MATNFQDWQSQFGGMQPQPKADPRKKKDFWTDQISTGGGIGGALGGAATGAAIGSIVPGIGTAIGGLAGGILGGALGSGGGEMVENRITGDDLWKNVGKEAALGGVFSAPPIRLAKGVATGGLALAKGGGGSAAKKTLEQALTEPGMLSRAGQSFGGVADNLAIKQFKLNKTQLTNLNKKLGEDTGTFIRKYGFTSADDITTKGIEPLQSSFDTVVANLGNIPKSQIKSQLDEVIKPLKNSVSLQEQQLAKNLQAQADEFLKKTGKTLTGNEIIQFRRLFDDGVKYSARGTAEFNVSKGMADGLRTVLQQSADKAGLKSADGRSLKEIGRELSKLYSLFDVAAPQEQLGRGNNPIGLTTLLAGGAGGFLGGDITSAALTAAGAAAVNSPTGRRAAMRGAEKIGSLASRAGQRTVDPMSLGQVGTRFGTAGVARGVANSGQTGSLEEALTDQRFLDSTNSPAIPMTTPSNMNPMAANMAQSYQETPQMSSPYGRENLLYDIQRDPANAQEYIQYYQMLQEVFAPQAEEAKPLTQGQQERADLMTALGMAEDAVSQGSINYGPIGSRIEGIKASFNAADPETLNFRNVISGLQAAITKARAGASLTEGERQLLEQYTPTAIDSEQMVRSKLKALRQLYGYSMPVGGNDGTLGGVLTGGGF